MWKVESNLPYSGLYKHFLYTVQQQKNWTFNSVLKLNLQSTFLIFRKYRYLKSFENSLLFQVVNWWFKDSVSCASTNICPFSFTAIIMKSMFHLANKFNYVPIALKTLYFNSYMLSYDIIIMICLIYLKVLSTLFAIVWYDFYLFIAYILPSYPAYKHSRL